MPWPALLARPAIIRAITFNCVMTDGTRQMRLTDGNQVIGVQNAWQAVGRPPMVREAW